MLEFVDMDETTTRDRILETAAALFGEHGFDGVSTTEIARAADVNKAMIFYYFGSKEKLYSAVFGTFAVTLRDRMQAVLEKTEPGLPSLEMFVRTHIGYLREHRDMIHLIIRELLTYQGGASSLSPILQERFPVIGGIRDMLEKMIADAHDRGQIRDVDTLQTIVNIISLDIFFFLGKPIVHLLIPQLDPDTFEAERVDHVIDLLLNGLRKTPEPSS